jgi:hypothetical protein
VKAAGTGAGVAGVTGGGALGDAAVAGRVTAAVGVAAGVVMGVAIETRVAGDAMGAPHALVPRPLSPSTSRSTARLQRVDGGTANSARVRIVNRSLPSLSSPTFL